ncbi:MAG: tRNA epoxyqueuosine(34) reductase QueG [Bacteroidia bacterium]|nr:tRNA epoxyqueuosine(34) reductase QueG [Bacteroidales bacterium]MDD3961676.1 tRNA epoxyqueuosine(34) reductase QueG [Bacteroidales bacterium]NCD41277.1 tRNA epoxyqueuosine(34) reductase QueG [Bacteroidia bacterium]
MSPAQKSEAIKKKAIALGFSACGIASARPLTRYQSIFESWLSENNHGTMAYMQRNIDKRLDPALLVEHTKSIITVLYNYYHEAPQHSAPYSVARYARGRDYHPVIREKLNILGKWINATFGTVNFRVFTDSAPVLEKVWAQESGLGWIGKNTCLIHPKMGSWFFIGEIFCDLELAVDLPMENRCGTCTRCLDACPTGALVAPGKLDARKCIAYLTIEHKGAIAPGMETQFNGSIFGCDICQQVCPWNRFAKPHQEPQFETLPIIARLEEKGLALLDRATFKNDFRNTSLERCGYEGLTRNIQYVNQKITK